MWEKTEIDVPVYASLEQYKDDYELKFYVDGVESNDFYVDYETNCSTFSTVLTNKVGKYTVYYKAYSKANYISSEQAIIFNVIDVTAPTITLDSSALTLRYGNALNEIDWYSVEDDTCESNDIKITIDDSGVIYNIIGTYHASITAKDQYGNKSSKDFEVQIIDDVKPQIQVLKPLIFNCNEPIDLNEYFLCNDDYDGDVSVFLEVRGLDTTTLGKKVITLVLHDYSHNELRVDFEIIVDDKLSPVIILEADEVVLDILKYNQFDKEFFIQYMEVSDNLTLKNDIKVNVDLSLLEEDIIDCYVTYIAIDEKGNEAETQLIVKLREFVGPQIVVEDNIDIYVGDQIDLYSMVKVIDDFDLEASSRLSVDSGSFDCNTPGEYKIKYTCFNTSGIYTEKVITINVNTLQDATIKNNNVILYILISCIFICLSLVLLLLGIKKRRKSFNH